MSFASLLVQRMTVYTMVETVVLGRPSTTPSLTASDVPCRVVPRPPEAIQYTDDHRVLVEADVLTEREITLGQQLVVEGETWIVSAPPRVRRGRTSDPRHYSVPVRRA